MNGDFAIERNDGEENFPTAVYTVYNIHGVPIGHRLYSYQPAYEPEESDQFSQEDSNDYNDSIDDSPPHVTVLKGGIFPDHEFGPQNGKSNNINKLKHQYFTRYIDRRKKRFLTQMSKIKFNKDNEHKNVDVELDQSESKITVKNDTLKSRSKRNIDKVNSNDASSESNAVEILTTENNLKVLPIEHSLHNESSNLMSNGTMDEMLVMPLQNNKTNSTEVENLIDKRDKRTSRKTDRLNQTIVTVPKT